MIRLLPLLSLLLICACEPPSPRPQVAMPLPTVQPSPTPSPSPTPDDGVPDRAALAARAPAEVTALEAQYRLVVTSLTESSDALSAIRAKLDSDLPDEEKKALAREAATLRDSARRLSTEAAELRRQAQQVKDTSIRLKAVTGQE